MCSSDLGRVGSRSVFLIAVVLAVPAGLAASGVAPGGVARAGYRVPARPGLGGSALRTSLALAGLPVGVAYLARDRVNATPVTDDRAMALLVR